ncbi:MAG: hypothetical protein ABR990_12505, partial [Terracidiphilus sp.]
MNSFRKNANGEARSVRARLRRWVGFTASGKMQMVEHEASGHDFVDGVALQLPEKCKWRSKKCQGTTSSMGWLYSFRKNASGEARSVRARLRRWGGFTASGKMQMVEHEASGHDFSRAVNATIKCWALALAVCFSWALLESKPFYAACKTRSFAAISPLPGATFSRQRGS